jgi:hypothetical protein
MLIRVSGNGKVEEGRDGRERAVPYYSSETSKLSLGPIFPRTIHDAFKLTANCFPVPVGLFAGRIRSYFTP